MRVLVIKTSSLGDVIHTLPGLTDAARALPGIRFDWVVEEAFSEIPRWHPAVERVIPVALRRWRRNPFKTWRSGEWTYATTALGDVAYDAVIDAQGLVKSAFLTRYVSAPIHGLDRNSAREPLASRFYTRGHAIAKGRHAVERVRELFAQALAYPVPAGVGDYGLDRDKVFAGVTREAPGRPYLVGLHGTTWDSKHWPETYWRDLLERAAEVDWEVRLPWGNAAEEARAERLAQGLDNVRILPRLDLSGVAAQLADARACIAVDTGLGHLAAALAVPTISLFGPTSPLLTGAWGRDQIHLASDFQCAPCLSRQCTYRPTEEDRSCFDIAAEHPLCFTRVDPARVWRQLEPLLAGRADADAAGCAAEGH